MAEHLPVRQSKRWRRRFKRREKRLLLEAQDPRTCPDRLRQLRRFPSFRVQECVYQNPNVDGAVWSLGLYNGHIGCWSNPCAPWYLSNQRAGSIQISVDACRRSALRCYRHRGRSPGVDIKVARHRIAAWLNDWVQHATRSYPLEFFKKLHPVSFGQGAAELLASIPLPADLLPHQERFERLLRWSTRWSGPEAYPAKRPWVGSRMDCGINCVGGYWYVKCWRLPRYYNDVYDVEELNLVQGSPAHHYIALWQLLCPWAKAREHHDLWAALEHFFPDETPAGVLRRFFPLTFLPQTKESP